MARGTAQVDDQRLQHRLALGETGLIDVANSAQRREEAIGIDARLHRLDLRFDALAPRLDLGSARVVQRRHELDVAPAREDEDHHHRRDAERGHPRRREIDIRAPCRERRAIGKLPPLVGVEELVRPRAAQLDGDGNAGDQGEPERDAPRRSAQRKAVGERGEEIRREIVEEVALEERQQVLALVAERERLVGEERSRPRPHAERSRESEEEREALPAEGAKHR